MARNPLLDTPSKRKRNPLLGNTDENGTGASRAPRAGGKVTIATVKKAINEATSSPLQQYLKSLPLASKLFLAALLARTRRTGVGECLLGDVIEEAKRLAQMAAENPLVQHELLTDALRGPRDGAAAGKRKAATAAVARVLGMGVAAEELAEAGVVGLEPGRRGERGGKLRLRVGDEEVRLALRNDGELKGLGFGG